jgi:hypothetical protein
MTEEVTKKRGRPPGAKNKADPVRVDEGKTQVQQNLEDENDMLYIHPGIIPDGMRYNWKTLSVLGAPQSRRYGRFQATGWEPVPASRHPGLFTPKGYEGDIEYDGLVLMEKSEDACQAAEAREFSKARDQVKAKEQQLRGGDVRGVGFDTQHPSARRASGVSKSYERFDVPEK